MAIDKIFTNKNIDGVADNLFSSVSNSITEVKAMQQRKAAENVQVVIQALRKIEGDMRSEYGDIADKLAERITSIKDGKDGYNGVNGKEGKDGRSGRDGAIGAKGANGFDGRNGVDGIDGVSVTNAYIDFDGSLIINLSSGQVLNVGEVVSQDLADKIQVISSMSINGAIAISDEGTSISTGVKNFNFIGATVTATASGDDVTINVSAGTGTVTSVAVSGGTTGLTTSGSPITTSGTITLAGTLAVANGGTGVTTSTGTGSTVLNTSPTLVTPALGTPSALVGTNITGTATAFTASNVTTNANLTGDITSVGNATTLTNAPVIAKVLTGYISGAGTVAATDSILQAIQKLNGNDATNANLTGVITSVGNATSLGSFTSAQLASALTDETGSGANVFATSPTLVTPALGTPSSGVVTNLTGTASININGTVGATTPAAATVTALTATADSAFTSTGSVTVAKGTTAQRPASPASGMFRFNTTTAEFEGYNGTAFASVGGAALSNDTATATSVFPLFANATTGTAASLFTSNAQYLFKPSIGELSVKGLRGSNGILTNSATVSANVTIATGDNAMSTGPITVNSGVTITVSSGSRYVVI